MHMKKLITYLFHFTILLLSLSSYAEHLNEQSIEKFANKVALLNFEEPKRIIEFISKELTVEYHIGSTVRGFSLFYNYQQFTDALTSPKNETDIKEENVDIYDVKSISPSQGEFKVVYYSKLLRVTIWEQYFVHLEDNEIKIIKIIDHII